MLMRRLNDFVLKLLCVKCIVKNFLYREKFELCPLPIVTMIYGHSGQWA